MVVIILNIQCVFLTPSLAREKNAQMERKKSILKPYLSKLSWTRIFSGQ